MLTIFTACRDSVKWPAYGIIQYNSVKSWTFLNPKPQILVLGDDPGAKELCEEVGVKHIADVKTEQNDISANTGVPIFSSMVEIAENLARKDDVMLFLSSDIIIFQNIVEACKVLKKKNKNGFCGVVQRYNKEINNRIDFEKKNWREETMTGSRLHNPCSGDVFMFPKGFWDNEMPPFMIGRARVDAWMFWYSYEKKLLVDMTRAVPAVHHVHKKFETNNNRNLKAEFYEKNTELARGNCYGENINISKANWIMDSSFNIKEKR